MKKIIVLLWLLGTFATAARAQTWTRDYGRLLGKYATPSGVRYAAWHDNAQDLAALRGVVAAIAAQKAPEPRDEKLAFYLNAYNANILNGVLEKYPIKSIRDIAPLFGFFTQKRITVSGELMSFNHLEKDVILKMNEPRVHFALNCASASCPPLRDEPFSAPRLDAQLETGATAFLSDNPHGVSLTGGGKTADVSKLFEWYAADFQPAGGTIPFINKFRKRPLPADAKVTIQEYDWSLNAAK